ncbi:PREDICTED: cell wall integrity and stress response component 4-like [Polistes canadensis]|uniref:cell wall integrity and stress response component 4-like n=1 Tax=Polistes canadensis TaxID=91411 RepID=UPI000718C98C|nr:PREDICTED: cell wall integrity and stress response component 4-like [Polistes canadensis]XP_014608810.1 PREDICTED: cell wall integrity and stress response component 4-like [Polistes canadensis]
MFQLSLRILLAALMFVNLAFTVPTEDPNLGSNKSKNVIISADVENITINHETYKEDKHLKEGNKNVTVNLTDHQKPSSNEGASLTKTFLATLHNNPSPIPPVLGKKEDNHTNQNATKRPIEETTPINQVTEIKNASDFTGEQKDLIEVSVSPRDEEDITTIVPVLLDKSNSSVTTVTEATVSSSSSSSSSPSSLSSSTTTLKSINRTITVDDATITKEKPNKENPDNEHKDNVENTTYQMNTTTTTATVSINVTTETIESSSVTSKPTEVTTVVSSDNDHVDVGISTAAVEKKESVVEQEVESNIKSKTLTANEKDSNGSMPPGIIVLVTTLAFAAAIVVGYISMVIWKQYLEHRYGRRELLVNELEFDTNDLRHFEL